MGSSKANGGVRTEKMVTMETDLFKDRLNQVYDRIRHSASSRNLSQNDFFEYLWDLKEKALMEGKSSLELPQNWLDKLEAEEISMTVRGH
jgi:hypothetical protein